MNSISHKMSGWTSALCYAMRLIAMSVLIMGAIVFSGVGGKHYAAYSAHGVTIGSYSAENTSGHTQEFFLPSHQSLPSENDADSFFEDTSDEEDDHHNSYPSSTYFANNAYRQLRTSCVYSSTSPIRVIPLYILFHSWQHYI